MLSKLYSTFPEVQFWEFFWDKNEKFFVCCNFLSGKFPEGLSKLLFMTSPEHFGTKFFFCIIHFSFFLIFRISAKNSWTFSKKNLASVLKTAFCFPRTAFWGKMMLLERICSYAFHVFRTLRKNIWVFGRNNLGMYVKNQLFMSKATFLEKTDFLQ